MEGPAFWGGLLQPPREAKASDVPSARLGIPREEEPGSLKEGPGPGTEGQAMAQRQGKVCACVCACVMLTPGSSGDRSLPATVTSKEDGEER